MTAEEAFQRRRFEVPVSGRAWTGQERHEGFVLEKSCKIERGHKHPGSVNFDDWLEFLGYFISEGGLLTTDHPSAEFLVYVDQKKPNVLEKMIACLDRLGWNYSTQIKPCGTTHMLLSNRCLRKWLIENIGTNSYDKRIPYDYLNLSGRQLQILFDALMAGDGSWDSRENRTSGNYASMSSELLGQVQRIALQIGLKASVIEPDHDNSAVGRVCLCEGETTRLSSVTEEKAKNTERSIYTGDVYCFSVPGFGFFVTRRNGKIAIQGNTAAASLDFAELQVFGPLREMFDWVMNKQILPVIGIKFHTYRSNAPTIREPEALSLMIKDLVTASVITPGEGRELSAGVFNRTFEKVKALWTSQPIAMTLAGRPMEDDLNTPDVDESTEFSDDGGGESPRDRLNANGGLSTGAAAATQEAVGVPQNTNKDDLSGGDLAAGGGALLPAQGGGARRRRRPKLEKQAAILHRVHAALLKAEREEYGHTETETIKVPADLFYSWVRPSKPSSDGK